MTVAESCSRHDYGERRFRQPAWRWRTSGYLLLLMCLVSSWLVTSGAAQSNSASGKSPATTIRSFDCRVVSQKYLAMNLPMLDVERMPLMGTHLKVCPTTGKTCCGNKMEKNLVKKAQSDNSKVFRDKQLQLGTLLRARIKSLKDFFSKLFKTSYNELNSMFSRTYGYQYQANKGLITNLFTQLREYHPGKTDYVKPILIKFFGKLFIRMFVLINREFDFGNNYLKCAEYKMTKLKPFGDKAELLIQQLTRAFVTTRTFMQGLQVAHVVLSNVQSKVKLSQECTKASARLRYCNLCAGLPNVRPCLNYCLNVVHGCFAQHSKLQAFWGRFIDTLSRTADTVSGPFNIKVIVKPLGFKISDAIMVFQNNAKKILKEVKKICGSNLTRKPMTNSARRPQTRRKRQARQSRQGGRGGRGGQSGGRPGRTRVNFGWKYEDSRGRSNGGDLGRLVKETTAALKRARNIWTDFPNLLCRGEKVAVGQEQCWNGSAVSRYSRPLSTSPSSNPEVLVNSLQDPVITQSINLLKEITSKLDKATKGQEVRYMNLKSPTSRTSTSSRRTPVEGSGDGEIEGSGSGRVWPRPRPQPRPQPQPRPRPRPQPAVTTPPPVVRTPDPDVEGSGDQEATTARARVRPTTSRPRLSTAAPPKTSKSPVEIPSSAAAVTTPRTTSGASTTARTTTITTTAARVLPPRPRPQPEFPDQEGSGDRPAVRPDPDPDPVVPRPNPDPDVEGSGEVISPRPQPPVKPVQPVQPVPPVKPVQPGSEDLEGSGQMPLNPDPSNPRGENFPMIDGKDEGGATGGGDTSLWLKKNNDKGGAESVGEGSVVNPASSQISNKPVCDQPHCAGTVARSSGWLAALLAVLLSGLLGALVAA